MLIDHRSQYPPVDSFNTHVLLFTWVYGPKHGTEYQGSLLSVLSSLILELGYEGMDSLVKDVISYTDVTKILPDDVLSRIIPLLQSPQEIDRNLGDHFLIIHGICSVRGIFAKVRSDRQDDTPGLAEIMTIACRRQLCSGDIEFDNTIVETWGRTML